MRLGKIVEGGQFEVVLEFRETDSPRTLSQFPFCRIGMNFSLTFSTSGAGAGRNLTIEIL